MDREYVLVFFIETPPAVNFDRTKWYLHLTLLGTFYSSLEPAQLTSLISEAVENTGPFQVKKTGRDLFGKDGDIAVTTVDKPAKLMNLHSRLYWALGNHIVFKTPEFNNDGYSPHVTDAGDKHLGDSSFYVTDVSLVELTENTAAIHTTVSLAN